MNEKLKEYFKMYKDRFNENRSRSLLPDFRNDDEIIEFIEKCLEEDHQQEYYYPLNSDCKY